MADDVYDDVRAERQRAHQLHAEQSMEHRDPLDPARLSILVEEVGEVAKALNMLIVAIGGPDGLARPRALLVELLADLRTELIQTAAMAVAWADVL